MRLSRSGSIQPGAALAAVALALTGFLVTPSLTRSQSDKGTPAAAPKTSYDQITPVLLGKVSFADMMAKDKAGKPKVGESIWQAPRKVCSSRSRPATSIMKAACASISKAARLSELSTGSRPAPRARRREG